MILEETVRYGDFEWDSNKNEENKRKHHISFETAIQIFNYDDTVIIPDKSHSNGEERSVAVGMIKDIISVVYTERHGNVIRVISAQKAKAEFRREYYELNNL